MKFLKVKLFLVSIYKSVNSYTYVSLASNSIVPNGIILHAGNGIK